MTDSLEHEVVDYVERRRDRLTGIVRDLVRIPSENTPPTGAEGACQRYAAELLLDCGWDVEVYELDSVAGLREHALYLEGRDYTGRPNLGARRRGTGGGRSLLLSGHMDTVPQGTQNWTREPFGGEIENGRLYGRGANDMKAGIAANLFIAEALAGMGKRLRGDVIIESVVDEEFGGANGTLAGRLKGFNAGAAVISEPTGLRVCPAQRGGRTAHLTLRGGGGILSSGKYPPGAVKQLAYLLERFEKFADQRRRCAPPHPLYSTCPDPVPVSITKIFTGPWSMNEPITVPEECRIELYWQFMPGEDREAVDREFLGWLDCAIASCPDLFPIKPRVEFPLRFLPGSAIPDSDPVVRELAESAGHALGQKQPPVVGIEGACDMFIFHSFGIPAVLWGPTGGNTHGADEYVDIESVVSAAKALLLFVCRWAGVEN